MSAPKRKMKNSELKKYLNTFPDDAKILLLIANPEERKLYDCVDYGLVMDEEDQLKSPVMFVKVGKAVDMDAELVEACEECEREAEQLEGQMDITDFPEVLP